jgi:hypothetical protein
LGLHFIFLEGDANVVVTTLNWEDEDFSRFGNIIVETREILKGFPLWNVSFVRRECNNAAHQLAKFAISQELNQVWMDSYPSCILVTIIAESHLSSY